jgi:hypothetical protein
MSEEIKPAYGLVQINITNQAEFMERYAQHVFPTLQSPKKELLKEIGQQCCASQAWPWQRSGTTQMTMLHTET